MAKTTAPLLSFGANGQIAKTQVYASWRGVKYSRRYVVPANPRTTAQQLTRTTFAFMREMWKVAPSGLKAPWDAFATGKPFLGLNKFVGENIRVLRSQPDMANFIGSPGAFGGLPPVSVLVTAGGISGEIDVAFTNPAPPSGWTITAAQGVAFPDQDPSLIFQDVIQFQEDTATFNSLTFTGLTPTANYCVSAWLQWQKPDGKTAYSVSVTDIQAAAT